MLAQSTVYASGKNRTFQLGIDKQTPLDDIPFTRISFFDRNPQLKILDIISSSISTFFLMDDSSSPLYGCGCNQFGQLSLGEVSFVKEITKIPLNEKLWIEKISCGTKHTLLLTIQGDLYACGASDDGQLSIQPGECVTSFRKILENVQIAKAIGKRTMIITKDFKFLVCGENNFGQLGLGDAKNRLSLIQHEFFHDLLINHDEFPIEIDGGISHTILMTNKKRIFFFGNTFPHVAMKPVELSFSSPKTIKCTNYTAFVITVRNKIFSCGFCGQAQLPIDPKLLPRTMISFDSMIPLTSLSKCLAQDEHVIDISGGSNHSCFHTNYGRVFICGRRFENGEDIKEPILIENPFENLDNYQDFNIRYHMGRSSFFVSKTLNKSIVNFKKQLLNCSIFDLTVKCSKEVN